MTNRSILVVVLSALAFAPVASAESVKGIVTELDPASGSVALFRNDTSREPRRLTLVVGGDARLQGIDSLGELKKGSEIEARLKTAPGAGRIEAESLALLGSSEETVRNLRSASLYDLTDDEPRQRPEPVRREAADKLSALAAGTGMTIEPRRPPAPRDTETDWYLSRLESGRIDSYHYRRNE